MFSNKHQQCVVSKWLLDNSRTFASSSVETNILDEWRNGVSIFPDLEKNILVQGHMKSRDTV